jgi:hypothetical protein
MRFTPEVENRKLIWSEVFREFADALVGDAEFEQTELIALVF